MNTVPDENHERLLLSFDQLASTAAFSRSEWLETTAALKNIRSLLTQISLGSERDKTVSFAEVSYPDPADFLYSWFLDLQETFHSNIANHLLGFLNRLDGLHAEKVDEDERVQIIEWTTQTLYLLQGCLLLHEPSRTLLSRRPKMMLICEFLDATHPQEVHMDAIQTLVASLVDRPDNFRVFENVGGLVSISNLFKDSGTPHTVKVKILEFLYFYLMPESTAGFSEPPVKTPEGTMRSSGTALYHGQASTVGRVRSTSSDGDRTIRVKGHAREPALHDSDEDVGDEANAAEKVNTTRPNMTKSTAEKQAMLGRYFNNIDALVKDLNEFKPFGDF